MFVAPRESLGHTLLHSHSVTPTKGKVNTDPLDSYRGTDGDWFKGVTSNEGMHCLLKCVPYARRCVCKSSHLQVMWRWWGDLNPASFVAWSTSLPAIGLWNTSLSLLRWRGRGRGRIYPKLRSATSYTRVVTLWACCTLVYYVYITIQGHTHTMPKRPSDVSRLQGTSLVLCVCGILYHVLMYAHTYVQCWCTYSIFNDSLHHPYLCECFCRKPFYSPCMHIHTYIST